MHRAILAFALVLLTVAFQLLAIGFFWFGDALRPVLKLVVIVSATVLVAAVGAFVWALWKPHGLRWLIDLGFGIWAAVILHHALGALSWRH